MEKYMCIWIIVAAILIVFSIWRFVVGRKSSVRTHSFKTKKAKGVLCYYLPESQLKIKVDTKTAIIEKANNQFSTEIISQTYQIETEIIADLEIPYYLEYKPDPWMSETIIHKVNASGLLETSNIVSEDKSATVIESVFEGINEVLEVKSLAESEVINTTIVSSTYDVSVRVSELKFGEKVINKIIQFPEFEKNRLVSVDASITIGCDLKVRKENSDKKSNIALPIFGLLSRPFKNAEFTIKPSIKSSESINDVVSLKIIDPDRMFTIAINRTPFVKRQNTIVFTNGIVTEHKIIKPSSVEGYISIPISLAKSVVSIPAKLISIRVNWSKKQNEEEKLKYELEKELDKAKIDQLKTEKELISLQLEIDKLMKA